MLLDKRYGQSFPAGLSCMPAKATLYSLDAHFWEGWEDLVDIAGQSAPDLARAHSLLLLGPDAIASRQAHLVLDCLPAHGFRLVACAPLLVDRHQVRSLWQYQWNVALRQRRDACDALMGACPSLLLVIAMRRPGDLRAALGHQSRMLSLVHSPDEAADFVREIAIFLPERQRKALFAKMQSEAAMPIAEAQAEVLALYGQVPEHSLDVDAALSRAVAAAHTGRQVLLDHPPVQPGSGLASPVEDCRMLIDQRFGSPIAAGLTEIPEKATLYSIDTYFREGWEDLATVAGSAATALASRHSMMLVKPDAIVSGRLDVVLDWLPRHGFSVVACVPMPVCPDQVKALWRYQWNCAPRIRKDAYMALFEASASILLVVRSTQDTHVSAAKRLANLKGPADPALQRPDDLRAWLGNATHLLSFVHAADEPADLVRELAILLPPGQRTAIHARMRDGLDVPDRELRAMAAQVCEGMPRHALGLPDAVARIEGLARADAGMDAADREAVAALCERARAGAAVDWRVLFGLLDKYGIPYDPWDRITIAAHASDVSNPHLEALLPGAVPLEKHA